MSGRSPGEGNGLPTPKFLLGEFHGQRMLVGCSPWVTESDTFSMGRKWHYVVTFFEENMVISFSSLLGKLNTNNILNLNLSLGLFFPLAFYCFRLICLCKFWLAAAVIK